MTLPTTRFAWSPIASSPCAGVAAGRRERQRRVVAHGAGPRGGAVCYLCGSCSRGQGSCGDRCRATARQQRRLEGRLDHRDRHRAYRARRRLRVTEAPALGRPRSTTIAPPVGHAAVADRQSCNRKARVTGSLADHDPRIDRSRPQKRARIDRVTSLARRRWPSPCTRAADPCGPVLLPAPGTPGRPAARLRVAEDEPSGACPWVAASARPVAACATIAGQPVPMGLDAIRGAQGAVSGDRRPPAGRRGQWVPGGASAARADAVVRRNT